MHFVIPYHTQFLCDYQFSHLKKCNQSSTCTKPVDNFCSHASKFVGTVHVLCDRHSFACIAFHQTFQKTAEVGNYQDFSDILTEVK